MNKTTGRPTVLIADDEPQIVNVVQRHLTHNGYDLLTACNGREALGKSKVQKPDIILLDIAMPEVDGLDVCRKLREDPATRLVPVLMLTARARLEDKVTGLNLGADDYMTKPFELDELQARIDALLKRTQNMIAVNPLTRLPGNPCIQEEISQRIQTGKQFGAAYIDVDNFKAYNDAYGYHQGDLLIVWLSKMIQEVVRKFQETAACEIFVGHIGGDDFLVVSDTKSLPGLCQAIADEFDRNRKIWYNWLHWMKGGITGKDRQGRTVYFPLMTLTTAVSTNERRKLTHFGQVAQITSEVKKFVKTRSEKNKSAVMFDRRTN